MEVKDQFDIKYLSLLSENYPTIHDASTEIINLQAIMQLPKGTEHFLSDIHGEHEAFTHIINNASGEIRQKVDKLFSNILTSSERAQFSTLIYYPEEKLKEIKESDLPDMDEWYKITLHRLIDLCHLISSKYSRSRVRKSLPADFDFVIDELINAEKTAREEYYESIIDTIVDIGNADEFIVALASVAKRLIVDRLHIVGDLFDRGSRPDIIIDMLSQHHAVDIQWGNHDVLWMGAASGSMACIAVVLNNSIKYGNLDCLETAYGINLRPLALFAQENYKFSKRFSLKQPTGSMKSQDTALLSKMYQAVCMIQFKLEGQIIRRHPEYHMADRLLLNKIDYTKGTIQIGDQDYPLDIRDFPAMNPEDPYILTPQEQQVMEQLVLSFRSSYNCSGRSDFYMQPDRSIFWSTTTCFFMAAFQWMRMALFSHLFRKENLMPVKHFSIMLIKWHVWDITRRKTPRKKWTVKIFCGSYGAVETLLCLGETVLQLLKDFLLMTQQHGLKKIIHITVKSKIRKSAENYSMNSI